MSLLITSCSCVTRVLGEKQEAVCAYTMNALAHFKDMGSMHAWIGGRTTTLCVVVLRSLIYVWIHSYSKAVLPSPGRHNSGQVRALMGSRTYCMGTDTCIRLPPDRILTLPLKLIQAQCLWCACGAWNVGALCLARLLFAPVPANSGVV